MSFADRWACCDDTVLIVHPTNGGRYSECRHSQRIIKIMSDKKVALITAGAVGIDRAIDEIFLANALQVHVSDRDAPERHWNDDESSLV